MALGAPRPRRALAACGGSAGSGMRSHRGDTHCQAAGSARSSSVCHPGVFAGNPAHGLQLLTGGMSPSRELRGRPGAEQGRFGHAEPLVLGLCSRLCCLQLASRARQRHRYNSLFLSILEGTLSDLFVRIKGHIQAVIHTAHRLLERLCVDMEGEMANLFLFGEHLGSRLRCQLLPGPEGTLLPEPAFAGGRARRRGSHRCEPGGSVPVPSPPVPGCSGDSLSPAVLAVPAEQRPGSGCGAGTPIPCAPSPLCCSAALPTH